MATATPDRTSARTLPTGSEEEPAADLSTCDRCGAAFPTTEGELIGLKLHGPKELRSEGQWCCPACAGADEGSEAPGAVQACLDVGCDYIGSVLNPTAPVGTPAFKRQMEALVANEEGLLGPVHRAIAAEAEAAPFSVGEEVEWRIAIGGGTARGRIVGLDKLGPMVLMRQSDGSDAATPITIPWTHEHLRRAEPEPDPPTRATAHERAQGVACPTCRAGVGEPCRNYKGQRQGHAHSARREAAGLGVVAEERTAPR